MGLGSLFGMDQTGSAGERSCLIAGIGYATAAGLATAVLARAAAQLASSIA